MKHKVVITGMGVISPLGHTLDKYWESLVNGVSGTDMITGIETSDLEVRFAAQVRDFNVTDWIDKKEARRMDHFTHFALAATQLAVADSGLNTEKLDLDRCGVITGSGIGGMDTFEQQYYNLFSKGPKKISPFFIPMMISDITPGHISIKYGFRGANYATTSACASSSHAIGNSFRLIQFGEADVMITGGSEAAITRMGIAGFTNMKALSSRNDDPKIASRPFDADRDGFVMGEGAGILVLESEEHALKRNAKIYAEVVGVGYTADAYHITAPVPGGNGAIRSMKLALRDAGADISEVDYINAHGTSTPHNDKTETQAIKSVFGEFAPNIPVSSTKSMIGHLLGASGGLELIATVLTMQNKKIHPTINYSTPDPECDLNYVPNKALDKEVNLAISNSFGFGGHNATIAVKSYQP
ncbi:beta-ketoacyl-ACP synthase II [candidate division KSB1 bacterium]|nr:beta-ketoacyl-ACP synthase II [candidate division KSB1 bacterium]